MSLLLADARGQQRPSKVVNQSERFRSGSAWTSFTLTQYSSSSSTVSEGLRAAGDASVQFVEAQ